MTGWQWTAAQGTSFEKVYFNLPFFIKSGCVERAIVSAGGPKISCKGSGVRGKGLVKREQAIEEDAVAPVFSDEERLALQNFYANVSDYYPWPLVNATTTRTLNITTTAA